MGYKNRSRSRTNLSQNIESYQSMATALKTFRARMLECFPTVGTQIWSNTAAIESIHVYVYQYDMLTAALKTFRAYQSILRAFRA